MKKILSLLALITLLASSCVKEDIPVTGVKLNESSLTLTIGDTEILTATVLPEDATHKAVHWSSSDTTVATVQSGTVTAIATGISTISVTTTEGNKTANCTVSVLTQLAKFAL